MKKTLILFITLFLCLGVAGAKEKMSVLYVGGSPDINTLGGVQIDSATVAKSVKLRMDDFAKFLRQHFTKVTVVKGEDYTADMSKGYDVTVFDGRPKPIRPRVIERDAQGKVTKFENAAYLPDDFDCATLMIAEQSHDLGNSIGSKNDWFCLCLDNYALGWKKDHPIFKGPFKVDIKTEMRPTPEHAKEYCPIYGYTLPDSTEMWLVHKELYPAGGRIGMVSRPWGYTDSPEAEVISSGTCAKSIDAVAIGRHGNFFHWGFAAKPSDMTAPAKAALANAIVYIKDFDGKRIIARKLDEGIATRANATASKYTTSRACCKENDRMNLDFYHQMDSMISAVKAKKAAGEKITPAETAYLEFPAPQKPVPTKYSDYLKQRAPELYPIFGEDEAEYARYYEKNRPYFYSKPEMRRLVIDQEARSLGIANNDIRLLDKAVELLAAGGDDAATGRTILERYTLCRFATPQEWKSWLDANRDRMFFTESGGWLWLVDTLDPSVPGNDYSVLKASAAESAPAPVEAAGATTPENPVALKAEAVSKPDGSKEIVITMTVHEGFHTYANLAPEDPFVPTEVTIELPEGYEKAGQLVLPQQSPSATATTYYTGTGAFRQPVKGSGKGKAVCTVKYQACDSSICLRPETKKFEIEL